MVDLYLLASSLLLEAFRNGSFLPVLLFLGVFNYFLFDVRQWFLGETVGSFYTAEEHDDLAFEEQAISALRIHRREVRSHFERVGIFLIGGWAMTSLYYLLAVAPLAQGGFARFLMGHLGLALITLPIFIFLFKRSPSDGTLRMISIHDIRALHLFLFTASILVYVILIGVSYLIIMQRLQ